MKETTKVVCPVCGTEFEIANHEHTATGVVIGKDSGLGTVYLKPAGTDKPAVAVKRAKAEDRLAALKAAGVDTSNLFAMRGTEDEGKILRMENGSLTEVPDNDPIFVAIRKGGFIPERRLFRRWVAGQVIYMMTLKDWKTNKPIGFTAALHRKGYEYQWGMIVEEFRVQEKLFNKDMENFVERNRWFNKDIAVTLAKDYIDKLAEHIRRLPEKKCKGVPYKRVDGRNIFTTDIYYKVFGPLNRALANLERAKTPKDVYEALKCFNYARVKLEWNTPQCPAWIDAYKGAGAFYTMKNFIMFSGCHIHTGRTVLSTERSLQVLDTLATSYCGGEGWRMFGVMKKLFTDNGINLEAKRQEWAKR